MYIYVQSQFVRIRYQQTSRILHKPQQWSYCRLLSQVNQITVSTFKVLFERRSNKEIQLLLYDSLIANRRNDALKKQLFCQS